MQRAKRAKTIFKKNKVEGYPLVNIKASYEVRTIKTLVLSKEKMKSSMEINRKPRNRPI